MTRQQLTLLLAAGAVVGALAGWFRPVAVTGKQSGNGAAQWSLPPAAALERSTAAQFAAVRGLRWVGDAGGSGGGNTSADWVLHGVLPIEGAILIQVGAEPLIKRVNTGDILPDRSRLTAVERDAAVIERDGCQTRRHLYPLPADESKPQSSTCATAGIDQDTPQP